MNLRIPDYYYSKFPQLSPALTASIDFLAYQQVPFRLFYNFTSSKRTAPLVINPTRHVQNQVVWLVFVFIRYGAEVLDLRQVQESCDFGSDFGASCVIHRDWVQVIADETDLIQSWGGAFDLNIKRQHLPLYFIVLSWSGSNFMRSHATLVRETCQCDDLSGYYEMYNFLEILGELDGIQRLGSHVKNVKRDFRGRRILIASAKQALNSWESIWSDLFTPYSFRYAHEYWEWAYVGFLDPFIRRWWLQIETLGAS